MKISVISFTKNGIDTAKRVGALLCLSDKEVCFFTKYSSNDEDYTPYVSESIADWTIKQFGSVDALIFIGAAGIAVRSIAPCIKDKLTDIPVIVIDELGKFVIPILSGHVGGANELAGSIAAELNAQAVITTATDINNKLSIDVFAKKNNLFIMNKDGIKDVSSKVLAGEKITISVDKKHVKDLSNIPDDIELADYPSTKKTDVIITDNIDLNNAKLVLRPRQYVLGIGVKKGKTLEEVLSVLSECLIDAKIDFYDLSEIASIDIKKDEEALIGLSRHLKIPFSTFTANELNNIKGDFKSSDYVKEITGTDNVCERSAMAAALEYGDGAKLIYKKYAKDGVTIAFAKRDWVIDFYE